MINCCEDVNKKTKTGMNQDVKMHISIKQKKIIFLWINVGQE